jgi:hypothetical protein
MAAHFVYEETPDKGALWQGDVLERTADLLAVLTEFHPHYSTQEDYKYFMVLTQGCDLVRRGSAPPKSPYVTIAAARPVEEVLRREAVGYQDPWQVTTRVIGDTRAKNSLTMFLQRLFDNNEPGYFYLHEDRTLGIHQSCCAVLPLSIALKTLHYDMLLRAKIAQLKEPFQAKLGWLIGQMYSRVGTTEWDKEKGDQSCRQHADKLLDDTFVIIEENKIKEGVAALKKQKAFSGMSHEQVLSAIRETVVLGRSRKFQDRAGEVIAENRSLKTAALLCGKGIFAMRQEGQLKKEVVALLAEKGEATPEDLAARLIQLVEDRLRATMNDETLPGRNEALQALIKGLLQDTVVAQILK